MAHFAGFRGLVIACQAYGQASGPPYCVNDSVSKIGRGLACRDRGWRGLARPVPGGLTAANCPYLKRIGKQIQYQTSLGTQLPIGS